eukprot:scaffold5398_cov120-Cylindrotheca_fusiformis.AAC.7
MKSSKVDETSSVNKSPNPNESFLPYKCVHCGMPCESLYYQLGASLSSIKALQCSKCGESVDPYIEREWLLVVIDCILMRVEAYRHVLFNTDELKSFSLRQLMQLIFAWSMLDAYLKWESHRIEVGEESELLYRTIFVISLIASSFVGILIEWLAVYGWLQQRNKTAERNPSIGYRVLLGLVLPSTFAVVTIFVMTWENTKTVRLLGSVMTAYWKGLAIYLISEDITAPVLGMIARALWQLAMSTFAIPCVGLQVALDPWGLQLCIT